MPHPKFAPLLAIIIGFVLVGAGCTNTTGTTQTNTSVAPEVTQPAEEQNSLPNSSLAPTTTEPATQPAPVTNPKPSPVPTNPTSKPAPTPEQTPTPAPTPAPKPVSKTVNATISGFAFQPGSITINAGDTVVWKNNDNVAHTVTADNGSFNSGSIAPGATYTHTFSSAGAVSYYCAPHPSMRGSVIVK